MFIFYLFSYFNTSLSELLYNTYDSQLANVIKPIVVEINKTRDGNIEYFYKSTEAVSTKLFQLYCELKSFSDYGMEICGNGDFKTKEYFSWFSHGVEIRNNSFTVFGAKTRWVWRTWISVLFPFLYFDFFFSELKSQ